MKEIYLFIIYFLVGVKVATESKNLYIKKK